MEIRAFRGLRYDPGTTDPGALAAPPFDQINPALRDRLHRTEHHFSHLTRPVAGDGDSPSRHAAATHAAWLRDGILTRDAEPTIYPYEIVLPSGGRRLGLCGLVGLEEPESGIIRPHEKTVDKTVDERLELLAEMANDLEPIMLFSDDDGALEGLLRDDLAGSTPRVEHRDSDGNLHRLHAITDGERIAAYRTVMAPLAALIADGHHRYRTAYLHARRCGAPRESPVHAKLAVITSLASPELSIDPIHRGLRSDLDLEQVGTAIASRVRWQGSDGADLARAVAMAAQPAIGVRTTGGLSQVVELRPDLDVGELPAAASQIAVVALHRALLPQLGLAAGASTDGTILYRSDPDELLRQVDSGELTTGIWLPPMPGSLFAAATAEGHVLPPKSTRFMPKLISGMVWSSHHPD